jgi:hypothetical protein
LAFEFEIFSKIYKIFSLGGVECEIFHNLNLVFLNLDCQSRFAGKLLELLVELEAVVTGTGAEYAAATHQHRRIDVTYTASAATLLLMELTGGTRHFATFL